MSGWTIVCESWARNTVDLLRDYCDDEGWFLCIYCANTRACPQVLP